MPWLRLAAISVLIVLLGLAPPARGAPAPIFFDFEDGLQGWELHGAATRVQTQLLGGEWAIFLDGLVEGGASILIRADFQTVGSVTFDQLIIDGSGSVIPVLLSIDLVNNTFFDLIVIGSVSAFVFGPDGPLPEPVTAFIDNITFHPVPEPSTWALLGLGVAALVICGATDSASGALRTAHVDSPVVEEITVWSRKPVDCLECKA